MSLKGKLYGVSVFISVLMTAVAAAQTQNYIAKFNSGGVVISSSLFDNGNIGLGTTSPAARFQIESVNGEALRATATDANPVGIRLVNSGNTSYFGLEGSTAGGYFTGSLPYSTVLYSPSGPIQHIVNGASRFLIDTSGNVGIGTTSPAQKLDIVGNVRIQGLGNGLYFPNGSFQSSAAFGTITGVNAGSGLIGGGSPGSVTLSVDGTVARLTGSQSFNGVQYFNDTIRPQYGMVIYNNYSNSSDVIEGICRNVGGYCMRLDQSGNFHISGYFLPNGQDYAESVLPSGDRGSYGPGDVITIDPTNPQQFTKSSEPYSTLVAGVYSAAPGILASSHPMVDSSDAQFARELPLAMVGIVPCKVIDENGPIQPGDLLVTSSTPGFAMRGSDPTKLTGAVLGKALGVLKSGKGAIRALVSLQ